MSSLCLKFSLKMETCRTGSLNIMESSVSPLHHTNTGSTAVALSPATVTGRLAPGYHAVNDGGSTSHPFVNGQCRKGTIGRTGAAFHASVLIHDYGFSISDGKDFMRADLHAHTAAGASFPREFNGCHARQILHKTPHSPSL